MFLTRDFHAKVGDVGGCVNLYKTEYHQEMQITPLFASPQLLNRALTNSSSCASLSDDIYSFGAVLFEAFTRHDAYQDLDMNKIMHAVSTGQRSLKSEYPKEVTDAVVLEGNGLVDAFVSIIDGCTEFEAQDRPLCEDLLKAFDSLEFMIEARESAKLTPLKHEFDPQDADLLNALMKQRSAPSQDDRRGTTAFRRLISDSC